MKKTLICFCLFFSLVSLSGPIQFGIQYLIGLGQCIVDYSSEWGQLTVKTGVCAWNKATLQKGV